ncbi:multiple epidermal growth factor-like domains protein 10 [Crassostrea angulata]|uniref:multiple epidermal growth factor-like domains protein 10 n=1 Tax=Magallana angulata TaxID=2784310 RepID=UPI0022B14AF8|nr:multiple epidermal growth factor-like domains protein 10 [Crassostrea angulata]
MDLIYVIHYLAGLSLAYAFDDLSHSKFASQSHSYIGTIYEAGNAVDRKTLTCMRTQDIGTTSLKRTVWWKVDLGGVYSIYSINILFKDYDGYENRQRGRFAGFSLYVSTTGDIRGSTLCYKNGPQLPPLNFTTTCTEHGRYVIFYNERLDGISYPEGYEKTSVYTELCEVIVQGCKSSGVFGIDCDRSCPANCKDNMCNAENRSCVGCKTGWTGTSCDTECMEGWYGVNCSQKCLEQCRDNSTCNHVTGLCDKRCDAGWTGTLCEKACQSGYYGENCSMPCSPNCKTCRNTDGLCSCKAGWMGHNCSIECTQSYGENCQYSCSLHCINQTCDRFNGNCLCAGKLDRMQDVQTNEVASSTFWIVAFCISLVINIIFISASLIRRRKTFREQKYTTDLVILSGLTPNTEQTVAIEPNHYQELGVSLNENTYPNLSTEQTVAIEPNHYLELGVSLNENTYLSHL